MNEHPTLNEQTDHSPAGTPLVAVAMSGGVDSSVAAALLQRRGYRVVGLTMKLFAEQLNARTPVSLRSCCNLDALYRAQSVCRTLEIPHYALDMTSYFNDYVVEDFISEYLQGRTPNPCVRCNTYLKWGFLFEKARAIGCDYLATGHYAQVKRIADEYQLLRAYDTQKDQSYALWGIPPERLSKTLLPLGDLSKPQVRKLAAELNLKTADTPDSQEICFIPEGEYPEFLERHSPEAAQRFSPGELCEEDSTGQLKRVGSHSGYHRYTIGQRKGLGGGNPEPRYVLRVEPDANRVVIGKRELLRRSSFPVERPNWLIPEPEDSIRCEVQIRYRAESVPGRVIRQKDRWLVQLDAQAEAVTPGQSAVFYQGMRVLGGGIIARDSA
jgi:tRNA-specific 2-thiouridylase